LIVNEPGVIGLVYKHQYLVEINLNIADAGMLSMQSGWYDAGKNITISALPNQGWHFMGWIGYGKGAYNGTGTAILNIQGPINELAIFYPSVTIVANGPGSITYQSGNEAGTVKGGESKIIYLNPNATLILRNSPDSFSYFNGWIVNGEYNNEQELKLVITKPTVIIGNFSQNTNALILIPLIVAIIALALIVFLIYRKVKFVTL
ncbi:MAG TPA: hypothetical protein VKU94_03410, partial [Geobacterales bacterium]|nr:hypothetical protein [Geobacterales bacterium]